MKTRVEVSILVWVVLCLGASLVKAQTANPNNKSLGDLARELAAQKSKAAKPAKVITNDNIATAKTEAATTQAPADKKPADVTAPANPDEKKGEAHNEKYYRSKMTELQGNLDLHKRELEVLQQKLGINQTQYYNDPNKTLQHHLNCRLPLPRERRSSHLDV